MQVAALFREATTLLGAGIEASEGTGPKFDQCRESKIISSNMKEVPPCYDDYGEIPVGGGLNMPTHVHKVPDHLGLVSATSSQIQDGSLMKYESQDYPYSLVSNDHMLVPSPCSSVLQHGTKTEWRKKKRKSADPPLLPGHALECQTIMEYIPNQIKARNIMKIVKERRKHDRFNGISFEEVSKKTLPDHLTHNLDIVIIGINPGLYAAYKGHHYAGPGNHFWKCLYLSGLTSEQMSADDDYKLLKEGIGFTNVVERATKGSADLTREEIKAGSQVLLKKLQKFKPKIAVFNGKLIFEIFSGRKDFRFGKQPELVNGTNTYIWVIPSSSARCAQLPRATDKVPFYAALKNFRDYLIGTVPEIDEGELVFSYLQNYVQPEIKEEAFVSNYNKISGSSPEFSVSEKKNDKRNQPKQKRGRPKQVKVEGQQRPDGLKPKVEDMMTFPKKKRGRPKKIKVDSETQHHSQHSTLSKLCSPPSSVQSPNMQDSFMYEQPDYNQRAQSPLPTCYHQSVNFCHFSQPASFSYSDLFPEISTPLPSEQNPESLAFDHPDVGPPANLIKENSNSQQRKDDICHFSNLLSPKSYQNYEDFSSDSDSVIRYPTQVNQCTLSKSLSGLECLDDRIQNVTDGEQTHNIGNGKSEHLVSQVSEDPVNLYDYPWVSHFTTEYNISSSNSSIHQNQNFVATQANSHTTDSTFSSISLAGNYTPSSYPSLIGPLFTTMMESNPPLFSTSLESGCRIDSTLNIPPGNPSMPYPHSRYANPFSSQMNTSYSYHPTTHNLCNSRPNFPYPSPYPNSFFPLSSSLQNRMFDNSIKQDRADIGFGNF